MMWPTLLLGLLVASVAGWIVTVYFQTQRIRRLERSHEEIQVEETLVFDFLHGLGEAFRETIRAQELHRLIVEGATRVLDAHGGALYITDRTGGKLTPAFISKGCPPLIDIPPNILQQAAANPIALESFLRLHTVAPGEGLIGRVWQTGQSVCLNEFSDVPELAKLRSSAFGSGSIMAAALRYGNQDLGVLALANGPAGPGFSQGDFVVFKSIAEQSAFALYNAIIYSMANEKKRLDHDLEIARDIQRILLPAEAPSINGFEISGLNVPARQVSGDYFDYIKIDDELLGVAIADVSGKGVPASISMAYVILDHARNGVTLARAGHDAPLLYKRETQMVSPLKPPGLVLGIDSGSVFDRMANDFNISLERGDVLVLYTDGVTEALDAEGYEFGLERMIQSVRASAPEGASA